MFLERCSARRGGHRALGASALVIAAMVGSLGCGKNDESAAAPAPAPSASASQPAKSTHNRVKFKGGERFVSDLAAALDLPKGELCKELGVYDCEAAVHKIALGGIEPYRQTVYQPVHDRSMSSVNAVDRMALSACDARAGRDFASPATAVLFKDITGGAPATATAIEAVSKRLYQRLLRRDATPEELAHLSSFHEELKAAAGAEAERRFAALACFAVATTEEALFY